MLEVPVRVDVKTRLKFRCKRHSKFNPAHGRDEIKGGCDECYAVLAAYNAMIEAAASVRKFRQLAERFQTGTRGVRWQCDVSPKRREALDAVAPVESSGEENRA